MPLCLCCLQFWRQITSDLLSWNFHQNTTDDGQYRDLENQHSYITTSIYILGAWLMCTGHGSIFTFSGRLNKCSVQFPVPLLAKVGVYGLPSPPWQFPPPPVSKSEWFLDNEFLQGHTSCKYLWAQFCMNYSKWSTEIFYPDPEVDDCIWDAACFIKLCFRLW